MAQSVWHVPLTTNPLTPVSLGPWKDLPKTIGELGSFMLPEFLPDISKSGKTASYTAKSPSLSPPEFSYKDDGVHSDLMGRWDRLVKGREDIIISNASHELWRVVRDSSTRILTPITGAASEDWVAALQPLLDDVVASLIQDMLRPSFVAKNKPSPSCSIRSGTAMVAFSQQGDRTNLFLAHTATAVSIMLAVAVEHKTRTVLLNHLQEMMEPQAYSGGKEVKGRAVVFKLMLQIIVLQEALLKYGTQARVRHGIVFTGHDCVLFQTAAGHDDSGANVHGAAISDRHIVCGPDADTPLLALLIAIYTPKLADEDGVTFYSPRHPGAQWATLWPLIQARRASSRADQQRHICGKADEDADDAGGDVGFGPGKRDDFERGGEADGGTEGEGDSVSRNGGTSSTRGRQTTATHPPFVWLDYQPLGWLGSSRSRLLLRRDGQPLSSPLSSPASSPTISPWSSPPSLPGSVLADPASLCQDVGSRMPSAPLPIIPRLRVTDRISSDNFADVLAGDLSGVPVILKSYADTQIERLSTELAAYDQLRDLAVAPKLIGIYHLPGEDWTGLLLEDAGRQVGEGEDWSELNLSLSERREIYQAVCAVHHAGVLHNDVAPRNIVRRAQGPFRVIDFGEASMGHLCPGSACAELATLREDLGTRNVSPSPA
ncbi:hypothetical protein FB451DRAFT_475688 [Mycena latifolia]|nr:hypothetical protein FB451DRAFT_475688 [Mycena latifolia]